MSDFRDFDSALDDFFSEFGFTATYLKSTGQNSYNTSTQVYDEVRIEVPVEAILMDLTLQSNGLSTKFGTLVVAGDKELFIRPSEKTDSLRVPLRVNPTKDKVRVNGVEYSIVTMKEINTTSTEPLVYDLYIRR